MRWICWGLDIPIDRWVDRLISGSPLSVREVLQGNNHQRWSSAPNDDLWQRWGLPAPSAFAFAQGLAKVVGDGFFQRLNLVKQAQEKCFDETGKALCKANDPTLASLRTERLDQGLRVAARLLRARTLKLAADQQGVLTDQLRNILLDLPGCNTAEHRCSLYDLIHDRPQAIEKMTSEPADPWAKRFGF